MGASWTGAGQNCFDYLVSGSYLRIAVPDGYYPDPEYIEPVKPDGKGTGTGTEEHRMLYHYEMLSEFLVGVGFNIILLEWFDENGCIHSKDWSRDSGYIRRSSRYYKRNKHDH